MADKPPIYGNFGTMDDKHQFTTFSLLVALSIFCAAFVLGVFWFMDKVFLW